MTAIDTYDRPALDLIKRTIAKGCTDDELELFARVCARTGLDPFARQIFAIKRWDRTAGKEVMQIQVSIDGLRTKADESGEVAGQVGPYWCGPDGVWEEVWLAPEPPRAAKVTVLRSVRDGVMAKFTGVALYDSYCQRKKDGTPTSMWATMAPEMLAKCAESLALRKGFPMQLSGLYTADEMGQSSNPTSIDTPLESRRLDAELPPPLPHPGPPQRPAQSHTEANAGTSGLDAMRGTVSRALGKLTAAQRSQALVLADAERIDLPDETGFTAEHANRWLEICREVTRGEHQPDQGA